MALGYESRRTVVVTHILFPMSVQNLHLETTGHMILEIANSHKHSRVSRFVEFKIEIEGEVTIFTVGRKIVIVSFPPVFARAGL